MDRAVRVVDTGNRVGVFVIHRLADAHQGSTIEHDTNSPGRWWHKVSRIGRDEVWNLQTHTNCMEYGLFEVGRSHLGNPGVVVGSEARFLLQGMNLALHLRHLVV
jgi:hypothetical protein